VTVQEAVRAQGEARRGPPTCWSFGVERLVAFLLEVPLSKETSKNRAKDASKNKARFQKTPMGITSPYSLLSKTCAHVVTNKQKKNRAETRSRCHKVHWDVVLTCWVTDSVTPLCSAVWCPSLWPRCERVAVCCILLQCLIQRTCECVAMCCDVMHSISVASMWVYCNLLQSVAICCSVLQSVAICCNLLQCIAICCSVLQSVAVYCNLLQCIAICCSVLQLLSGVAMCCSAHLCSLYLSVAFTANEVMGVDCMKLSAV